MLGNVTNRKSLICAGSDRGHWSDQQVDHAQPLQTINPRDGQHGNDKKQEFEGFETEAGECLPAESEHRQYGSLSGTQMYGFRFMKISLNSWNNLSAQMTILGIMAGGAASFAAYWYRLDSYYIVLYASAGAFLGLALAFLDSSFSIGLKQQRLANALLEYTDNSVLVRAFRDNAGQQERFQDSARRLPVREADTDELSEREAIIRENAIRDGLIKEAVKMPERQREAEDKASLFRAKKADKPAGLKRLKARKRKSEENGCPCGGEKRAFPKSEGGVPERAVYPGTVRRRNQGY